MRGWALALGIPGLVLCAAALGLGQWAGFEGGPAKTFGALISDFGPLSKLALILIVLSTLTVLVVAGAAFAGRQTGRRSDGLTVMTFTSPGLALLAAAEAGYVTYVAAARLHPRFIVMAPSIAEVMLLAALGLLAGALPATLNTLLMARAKTA